jgi:hypothetical protein
MKDTSIIRLCFVPYTLAKREVEYKIVGIMKARSLGDYRIVAVTKQNVSHERVRI